MNMNSLLNISFGIFAFSPPGQIYMAIVILGEAFILSKYLVGTKANRRIYLTSLLSNAVSGVVGIIISLAVNGGWWLVVWHPWVSSHEVNVHNSLQLKLFALYYAVALILSVSIEFLVNHLMLKKLYASKKILKATMWANLASYALGTLLLVLLILFV